MKGKTSIVGIIPKERGWRLDRHGDCFFVSAIASGNEKASILSNNNGFLIAYMKRKATLSD
ncbi:hypothetical protein NXX53_09590 [Bacteroides salyersiae]|nr:hypothetical protein [Bacteroides salyersiae]